MKTKKLLLCLIIIVIAGNDLFAQRVGYDWVKPIDSSFYVYSAIDFQSNIITASKGHVQKFDSLGNLLWTSNDTLSFFNGISVDKVGNIYVTGIHINYINQTPTSYTAKSFVFVEKFDDEGNKLWISKSGIKTTTYPDEIDVSYAIQCDNDDGVYITGSFTDSVIFGSIILDDNNSSAIFLTKYDSLGNVQWAKKMYGTNTNDGLNYGQGNDVAVDPDNNIYVTGYYRGPFKFGNSIFQSNMGSQDIFLSKLDANGNFLYTVKYGGNDADEGCRIAVSQNDEIALLAKFGDIININGNNYQAANNYNNPIIIKYSGDSVSFVLHLGKASNGGAILSDICFDPNNEIIYGGWVGFDILRPTFYMIDTNGAISWSYTVSECSSSTNANVYSIVSDASGVYVAGSANSNVYFGDTLLNIAGNQSFAYLGKIDSAKVFNFINSGNIYDGNFKIFPNPTEGQLFISSNYKSFDQAIINIYNIDGKILKSLAIDNNDSTISIENLCSGVYVLEIVANNYKERKKVVKY